MAAIQTPQKSSDRKDIDDYIPISIATLVPGHMFGARLYVRESSDRPARLYKAEDVAFDESDRQKLVEAGKRTLLIRKSDHSRYQEHLREVLPDVMADEAVPSINRIASLGEVVRDVMTSSISKDATDKLVSTSNEFASDCVSLLTRDDFVATDLIGVLHHDYHTFTHSTNVSFYAVMLAKAIGIVDEVELSQIATGGLLHDLGKLEIPEHILTKPAKLTDDEFEVIRSHPKTGFQKLCHRDDLSLGQLMMVYQHHERLDGRGYPVGAVEKDIHIWAKVCTVVDVFEALTSNRPYRSPLPHKKALEILQRESGTAFDKEILECWKAIINANSTN